MAIQGKKLSELTEQVSNIQGKERIYVSDGSGKPKFIETNQLATSKQLEGLATKEEIGQINTILDTINGEVI